MKKPSVLFICVHNSARSQIAEAYVNEFGQGEFTAESAGFTPTSINPYVVEVMKEEGIDLSHKKTQSVFALFKDGKMFDYVITVCSEAVEGECPIFPGMTHRLHLPFPDPSRMTGSKQEILAQVRDVRNQIKDNVRNFLSWAQSDQKIPLGDVWEMKPVKK